MNELEIRRKYLQYLRIPTWAKLTSLITWHFRIFSPLFCLQKPELLTQISQYLCSSKPDLLIWTFLAGNDWNDEVNKQIIQLWPSGTFPGQSYQYPECISRILFSFFFCPETLGKNSQDWEAWLLISDSPEPYPGTQLSSRPEPQFLHSTGSLSLLRALQPSPHPALQGWAAVTQLQTTNVALPFPLPHTACTTLSAELQCLQVGKKDIRTEICRKWLK